MIGIVALLVAAAMSTMTAARPGESPASDVVVTGQRAGPDTLRRRTSAFVRRISSNAVQGQLARWHSPICPAISGLDSRLSKDVAARIRTIATQAGAPMGLTGCRPNMIVAFVADAKPVMAAIARSRPEQFRSVPVMEREMLITGDHAVRWWYATEIEGADGRKLTTSSPAIANPSDLPNTGETGYLDSYHSSLIDTKMRVRMNSVTVVVDAGRATGARLDAVAAYIAFVGVARVRMATDLTGMTTILNLFASSGGQRGELDSLTAWDAAYLAGLYRVPVSRPARVQRSLIAGGMRTALTQSR